MDATSRVWRRVPPSGGHAQGATSVPVHCREAPLPGGRVARRPAVAAVAQLAGSARAQSHGRRRRRARSGGPPGRRSSAGSGSPATRSPTACASCARSTSRRARASPPTPFAAAPASCWRSGCSTTFRSCATTTTASSTSRSRSPSVRAWAPSSFSGNQKRDDADLQKKIFLRAGETYSVSLVQTQVDSLLQVLPRRGLPAHEGDAADRHARDPQRGRADAS